MGIDSARARVRIVPLVGPTAVGKTDIAHLLAERTGWPILSVDAMLVYRGMDIGTTKPDRTMRERYRYAGVDLVDPDQTCHVARYLELVRPALAASETPWIAVGGTGLYFRCLLEGLAPRPPPLPDLREEAEHIWRTQGVEAVQEWVRRTAPLAWELCRERDNPRRLIRWVEAVLQGMNVPERTWSDSPPPLVGLRRSREELRARIAARARHMFAQGLLDEVRDLRRRWPVWSPTASQAIGYREAWAALDGRMSVDEALHETIRRTVNLARRQLTWFRHQACVEWVEVSASSDPNAVADAVQRWWDRYGPYTVDV